MGSGVGVWPWFLIKSDQKILIKIIKSARWKNKKDPGENSKMNLYLKNERLILKSQIDIEKIKKAIKKLDLLDFWKVRSWFLKIQSSKSVGPTKIVGQFFGGALLYFWAYQDWDQYFYWSLFMILVVILCWVIFLNQENCAPKSCSWKVSLIKKSSPKT